MKTAFPKLTFAEQGSGVAPMLGHPLVDNYLESVSARLRPNCELTVDAIVKMNETNWLRVPVGKLHTDRYVPLHPSLIELHRDWLAWNGQNTTGRLMSNKGRPLNRDVVTRIVKRCARVAGIGHVHPHQLRHTLATQSKVGLEQCSAPVSALTTAVVQITRPTADSG